VAFDGAAGEVPASVAASLDGGRIAGRVDVPEALPAAVRALAPSVSLAEAISLHATVRGSVSAPQASIRIGAGGGDVRVEATLAGAPGAAWIGDAEIAVDGVDLPRVIASAPPLLANGSATVHVDALPDGPLRARGEAHLAEPGMPIDVRADFVHAGATSAVDLDARATVPELARVRDLGSLGVRGAADLRGRAHVDLARGSVEGTVEAELAAVRVGAEEARLATVRALVRGPLASPSTRIRLAAQAVTLAGHAVDLLTVDAEGPSLAPTVEAALEGPHLPRVRARASLDLAGVVEAHDVVVELSRPGAAVVGRAARVRWERQTLEVTDLEVTGAGQPLRGDAMVGPRTLALRVVSTGVDVATVVRLLGRADASRGTFALDLDLRADGHGATGYALGALQGAGLLDIARSDVRFGLSFAGSRVEGGLLASLDGTRASAVLRGIDLGGPLDEPASWHRATGVVDLTVSGDPRDVARLLRGDPRAFRMPTGRFAARARVARPDPTDALTVAAVVADGTGPLARLEGEARPPFLRPLRGRALARALLEHTPVRLHAEMPDHDVATLPPLLRPPAIRGRFAATLDVDGELADPRVRLQARTSGLTAMQANGVPPFAGTAYATYDGRAVIARAVLRRPDGASLDVRADVDARVADLLSPPEGGPPWDASGTVALSGFPLESVPPAARTGVAGLATGVVSIEGLHRDARVDADVRLARPRLGGVCFDSGWLKVRADGQHVAASARIEGRDSFAQASFGAASHWGREIAPRIDTSQPIDLGLDARDLRAAALMPLLSELVPRLDGRIDANARIRASPGLQTGTMTGEVRLRDGVVEIPAIGEPFRDVSATVAVRPWGTLRVDGITASSGAGRLTGSALASFEGMVLRLARADIEIPEDKRIPLTIEGVSLGDASGHLHADATMSLDQKELDLDVNVPDLDVRLPHSTGRALQSLEPAAHVVIGMREPDGQFIALNHHAPAPTRAPDSTRIQAVVRLGQRVRLRRDTGLDVNLTGSPVVAVTDRTRVTGAIHLTRGTVDVFGKRFTIEPASSVSFTGDPDNPQLVVSASYAAPDGTRIYADVVGPSKKLAVKLRSEPPRSQDELVGLLLFGSDEGLAGTPPASQQPDPTQRAAGLASAPLTAAVNHALSGITSLDVTTRLDTSEAANPRPEVEVRLSNELVARVTVQTGMPAPGEPPDRTLVSLDWRFKPRWSLETTVGDQGSTFVDVLWRHRY
jgi:translocation and assembly module TamB